MPYFLLGLTVALFFAVVKYHFGNLEADYFPTTALAFLLGRQTGFGSGIGCQALWFVYTLFLAKCVANIIGRRWIVHIIVSIIFLYGAQVLSTTGVEAYSSFANLLVAYPFFAAGFMVRSRYTGAVDRAISAVRAMSNRKMLLIAASLMALVGLGAWLNGMVEMYNSKYGADMLLFMLNGLIGSVLVSLVCMRVGVADWHGVVRLLSRGSILVLAWQIVFLFATDFIALHAGFDAVHNDLFTFAAAIIIYALFIPIIKFVIAYIPVLVGNR